MYVRDSSSPPFFGFLTSIFSCIAMYVLRFPIKPTKRNFSKYESQFEQCCRSSKRTPSWSGRKTKNRPLRSAKSREFGELWRRGENVRAPLTRSFQLNWPEPILLGRLDRTNEKRAKSITNALRFSLRLRWKSFSPWPWCWQWQRVFATWQKPDLKIQTSSTLASKGVQDAKQIVTYSVGKKTAVDVQNHTIIA